MCLNIPVSMAQIAIRTLIRACSSTIGDLIDSPSRSIRREYLSRLLVLFSRGLITLFYKRCMILK